MKTSNREKQSGYKILCENTTYRYFANKNTVIIFLKIIAVVTVAIFLIFFTKRRILYTVDPYKRMLSEAMDEINEKLDVLYRDVDPKERNKHFKALKFKASLTPLRCTATTAVFKVVMETGETTVLKRIIWNDSNGLNEDRIVMELKNSHPNLVVPLFTKRTYRFVKTQDGETKQQVLIWIFFEYLEIKVSERTADGDEYEIRMIMKDVLKGVKYLHDRNLAHCDIKIPNIMGAYDNDGDIYYKLLDFGYTQRFDERIRKIPGKSFGTFPYKPPEVMLLNIHGMPGDVWCIGMTAYYLSSGRIKFYNSKNDKLDSKYKKFAGIINRKMNTEIPDDQRYDFASDASEELKDFIMACTRIDYRKRPTIDELLLYPFITDSQSEESSDFSEFEIEA